MAARVRKKGTVKAIDAVANLRKLADLLEKHGELEIGMSSANVWVDDKEAFKAIARDFPRPAKKRSDNTEFGDITLETGELSETGKIGIKISQSLICELVEPAKPAVYRCPSIFSPSDGDNWRVWRDK